MGDKSPKATSKHAAQKQTKATTEKKKKQQAAAAKFLTAGENIFGAPTPTLLAAQIKGISAGDLSIKGDAATLAIPADTATQTPGGTGDPICFL